MLASLLIVLGLLSSCFTHRYVDVSETQKTEVEAGLSIQPVSVTYNVEFIQIGQKDLSWSAQKLALVSLVFSTNTKMKVSVMRDLSIVFKRGDKYIVSRCAIYRTLLQQLIGLYESEAKDWEIDGVMSDGNLTIDFVFPYPHYASNPEDIQPLGCLWKNTIFIPFGSETIEAKNTDANNRT